MIIGTCAGKARRLVVALVLTGALWPSLGYAHQLGWSYVFIDVAPEGHEDDEPLLLIHGHSSRLEEYEALVPHLAKRRRVMVPDLPGSGTNTRHSLGIGASF